MTNDEATDILLGPPPRVRMERMLERMAKTILQAHDAGFVIEMEAVRTVGFDDVRIVQLGFHVTAIDVTFPMDGSLTRTQSTKILNKNR